MANPAEPQPEAGTPPLDARTIALATLAFLAVAYTLYFARAFFLPVVLALLLNFLLRPAVRSLARFRLSEPVAAGVVMLLVVGALSLSAYTLSDPMQGWIARAPQTLSDARSKIRKLIRPVERAAAQVESATKPADPGSTQQVVVKGPTLAERIYGKTPAFLLGGFEVLILLYFLLASGDLFLEKLVRVIPEFADKKKAVRIAREAETSVSIFLGTVTLINVGLGLVIALLMAVVGMPNPLLWGVAAGLLEFVPYAGATTMTAILSVAALVTFDDVGHALLVPALFVGTTLIQAYVVSPILLGRRLTLNPVAIFVALLFWSLVWGVAGAFLAVPLLATLKIFCDHIERLQPVGEFLGR
jgi:predicted PurR-regulated permease PerM